MKVGDIVKQRSGIIRKAGKPYESQLTGIVISINKQNNVPPKWKKTIGRSITVLWGNGRLTENFAESSLTVVNKLDNILDFDCTLSMG